MPLNVDEIVVACELLARQEEFNICTQQSMKGAAVAGLSTLVGGCLFGSSGIAIGGTIGGLIGSVKCRKFKPVWQVIQEMNPDEKELLAIHMSNALLWTINVADAVLLMSIIANPLSNERNLLVLELGKFLGHPLDVRQIL